MDSPLPLQVIVQGLLTVSGPLADSPSVPTFAGRGVSDVARISEGIYDLTLDEGLPGNAGEVVAEGSAYPAALVPGAGAGASSLTNVPTPDIRCVVTIRGTTTAATPGGTTILSVAVSYLPPSPVPAGYDGGFTRIRLVFQGAAAAVLDPTDINAAGAEIIVFKDASSAGIEGVVGG